MSQAGPRRVVVAMSGGVDSAVAALLLQRRGYEVIGVTMQVWPRQGTRDSGSWDRVCCGLPALDDARRVAWQLQIPHYVLDLREEFEELVISRFCREYHAGRTPNPCLACNRDLKFGVLLQRARGLGADYLATGHYARTGRGEGGELLLRMAADRSKDQSYALYQVNQQQLGRLLFPLGDHHKREVRQIARQAGLSVAEKAESQEICFVSEGSYADFVYGRTGSRGGEGVFRHVDGEILGRHRGICCYTVGQRRGLGLGASARRGEDCRPLYVTRIDSESNTVWVGAERDLYRDSLIAGEVNYISGTAFERPRPVQAKIRYRALLAAAMAVPLDSGRLRVDFQVPQKAIAPGQAVVLYDGDMVLGGGAICQAGS